MNKALKIILRDARVQILGVLFLVWLVGLVKFHNWQTLLFPLYSVVLFTCLDLLFTYIKTGKLYYPFSSIVSGLLIGFLIHPSQGIITISLAVLLAFISKRFIKLKGRHVFNPAAFGVIITTLIFGSSVSWWMTASGGIFLPVIAVSSLILFRLKRLPYTAIFLAGYFIFFCVISGIKAAAALTFDGTVFLFAFIMLTEPMTSSITSFWKWGFGLVVLLGIIVSYLMKISFTDPLLLSLLLANLLVKLSSILPKLQEENLPSGKETKSPQSG